MRLALGAARNRHILEMGMQMQCGCRLLSAAKAPVRLPGSEYSSAAVRRIKHGREWPAPLLHSRSWNRPIALRLPRISSSGPHTHAISRPYNRMFSPQLSPDFFINFSTSPRCFPRWRVEPCRSLAIFPGSICHGPSFHRMNSSPDQKRALAIRRWLSVS